MEKREETSAIQDKWVNKLDLSDSETPPPKLRKLSKETGLILNKKASRPLRYVEGYEAR